VLYSYKNPKSYKQNNIVATYNLIKIVNSSNVKKFIFSSSSSVYGDQTKFPITENAKLNPKNYYAVTKKICEQKIRKSLKIPYIIFRIFTVYGSLGRPDMFFSIFLKNIYRGLKNKLFNYGNYFRDFTYIDDVINCISKIIYKIPKKNSKIKHLTSANSFAPYKIFNVGFGKSINLLNYIKVIEKNLGINSKKIFREIPVGDVRSASSDATIIKKYINYYPKTSIQHGIKSFINWYKFYYNI
jgi:UDP-glucuronate 4-epimerase